VGTPIANRGQAQLEPLIGFFVNTLVMNTDLSGQPSFEAALQRVQETCLDAYSHQDIPFERLVEVINPIRDPSRTPLFQTLFSYQDMSAVSPEMDGVWLEPFELPVTVSRTDTTLWLTRGLQSGLHGLLEYSTDLFDAQTIEGFIERFQVLLEGIVAAPKTAIGELPLLLLDERERLVHEWNVTESDYPRDVCVHELFEVQANQSPEATAIIHDGEAFSYQNLDQRSSQLAQHLISIGVEPGQLVGILLDRSDRTVVALLAVLKAGCAYLPLDPAY
ncbi:MAG: AMP-binding protein, partial [Gammaproteobacteria bacterium]|nr:AMP-binding protein [Gammaproteobacteria bacterium]